jgi:hypothetical protein
MKKGDKELFQGKYRIPSTRLHGWDYRRNAYYFVTICIKNRLHAFGIVDDKKMILNELGTFTDQSIEGINHHMNNVSILNHVVMPNHVHIRDHMPERSYFKGSGFPVPEKGCCSNSTSNENSFLRTALLPVFW